MTGKDWTRSPQREVYSGRGTQRIPDSHFLPWKLSFILENLDIRGSILSSGSDGKESANANAGDLGLIPGSGISSSWRRTWQPTPVFLPGEFHGQRSLAGKEHQVAESDMTEGLTVSLSASIRPKILSMLLQDTFLCGICVISIFSRGSWKKFKVLSLLGFTSTCFTNSSPSSIPNTPIS